MPFGYVSKEAYDAEFRRRAEAQKIADERLVSIKQYQGEVARLNHQISEMRADHAQQIAELITEHLKPQVESESVKQPDGPVFEEMTYQQIMAQPAVGKREMQARQLRADQALQRQEQKNSDEQQKRREELLTDEEKRATMPDFDSTLGVWEMTERDAAHDSSN